MIIKENKYEDVYKKIEKCNKACKANPVVCARKVLKEEIRNDKNIYLQIKAECDWSNWRDEVVAINANISCLFGILAVACGFFSVIALESNEHVKLTEALWLKIYILLLLIYVLIFLVEARKRRKKGKLWSYINTVLNEEGLWSHLQ